MALNEEERDRAAAKAKFDQDLARIRDGLPKLWRALYLGCIEEGFTEAQSLELLKQFIHTAKE